MTTNEKKEAFLLALEKSAGNITMACRNVSISRQTFYDWTKPLKGNKKSKAQHEKDAELFKARVRQIEETNLDLAETKLLQRINGQTYEEETRERRLNATTNQYEMVVTKTVTKYIPPSDSAIALMLKTKGKTRGFVEKTITDLNIMNVSERVTFSLKERADEND